MYSLITLLLPRAILSIPQIVSRVSAFLLFFSSCVFLVAQTKLMDILRAENRRHTKKKKEYKLSKMAASLAQESAKRGNGDDVTAVVVVFN